MSEAMVRSSEANHRFWIPVLIVTLAICAVATLMLIPDEILAEGDRNSFTLMAVVASGGLIGLWYLLLSGYGWTTRIIGLLFAALALAVTLPPPAGGGFVIKGIEFNGFMVPNFRFAWDRDHDAELARHRRLATGDVSAHPVDLSKPSADDMPEYRGPRRDGIVPGPPLKSVWSESEPKRLWRQPVGGGYAAFSVVGGWTVTIEQRAQKEAVVCYDVADGQERWIHEYPAYFHETLGGDGPRATPTVHDGKVFSLGATGELACLDGGSGKPVWQTNVLHLIDAKNLTWGMAGSPLVFDGKVVVTPGTQSSGSTGALLAVGEADGKVVWRSGTGLGGYASPMLAELLGQRQILSFEGEGIASYSASDGKELWRHPWKSDYDVNAAQPIVIDDRTVLISSNAGTALLEIAKKENTWSATPKWTSRDMKCHYSNPIRLKDHVYGLDNGILACISLADGKRAWKGGRYGHGQMLLRGSILVILSEKGEVAIVEATPDEYHELGKIQALEAFKTWNNPALVGNRLLVRNHLEMAAFELPLEKAE